MIQKLNIRHGMSLILLALLTLGIGFQAESQTIEEVIPADTYLFLKLQNLAACREAIETSDDWNTALTLITNNPKWDSVNQFLQTLPMFLGTDINGVINNFFADKIALTVSPGEKGILIGLVIENEGKTSDAEQALAHLVSVLSIMGNQNQPVPGNYRDIPYQSIQLTDSQDITYGNLNSSILLVGATLESFKKMVDVYRKERPAIVAGTPAYSSTVDRFGDCDIFAYVDVTQGGSYLKALLPPSVNQEFQAFQTLGYSWDLLRPGGGHRFYGGLDPTRQDTLISQLKADTKLQTTRGMTGTEDFFVALSPEKASLLWRACFGLQDITSEIQSFLLPSAAETQEALAGEQIFTLDFSNILYHLSGLYNLDVTRSQGTVKSVTLNFPELDIGWVFKPNSPRKWKAFFKKFLEKIATEAQRKGKYKGIQFYKATIPGTIYYAYHGDFFLLTLSEKRFQTIVDNLFVKTPTGDTHEKLALIDAPPTGVFQLKLGELIGALAPTNLWMERNSVNLARTMEPILGSLVVENEAAWVEITHTSNKTGIDVLAKLAPFLFLGIMHGQ